MVTRAAILLAIALILPATALAASNVTIERGGHTLTHLPQNNGAIDVTIAFTPDPGASVATIAWTAPDGSTETRDISVHGCPENRCSYTMTTRADTEMQFRIIENDDDQEETYDFSLGTDEQAPRIRSVSINGCTQSCVYSSNSDITIELEDETGGSGIDTNNVEVAIAGTTTAAECQAHETITCTAQLSTRADAELTVTARDRAGNRAQPKTLVVRYDDQPPQIISQPTFLDIYSGGQGLPGGAEIPLQVTVNEPEQPSIRFTSEVANGTGECRRDADQENHYICTASFTPPNQQYQGTGTLTVTDAAGNSNSVSVPLDIYASDGTTTPNFWKASAQPTTRIDASTWRAHAQDLPIDLTIEEQIRTSAIPVRVQMHSCTLTGASNSAPDTVVRTKHQPQAQRSTHATLRLAAQGQNVQSGSSEVFDGNITCKVDIYTRAGNIVFRNPETETISFEPEFLRIPPPEEAIEKHIENSQQQVQNIQAISTGLRQFYGYIQAQCSLSGILKGTAAGLSSAAGATSVVDGGTLSGQVQRAAEGVNHASDQTHKAVGKFCEMMTCDSRNGPYGSMVDSIFDADAGVSNAMSYVAGAPAQDVIDPYKSIIVAAGTGCLPAINYHVQNFLHIQCTETTCLQSAQAGASTIESCRASQQQATCEYFAGAAYFAIPYTAVYDRALNNLETIFSNPLSLIGISLELACGGQLLTKATLETVPVQIRIPCSVTKFTQDLNNLNNQYTQIKNTVDGISNALSGQENMCGQAPPQPPMILPFTNDPYCNGGFSTYSKGGADYVVADGQVCQCVDQRQAEGTNIDNPIGSQRGCNLKCDGIPSDVQAEAREINRECQEQGLSRLDGEAKESYERAKNSLRDKNEIDGRMGDTAADIRAANQEISTARAQFHNNISGYEEGTVDVDGLAAAGYTKEQLQEALNNPAKLEELKENQAVWNAFKQQHPGVAENLETVAQKQRDIQNLEEDLDELTEDAKTKKKELKEAERALKYELMRQEYDDTGRFVRRTINSGAMFGRLGNAIDSTGFTNIQGSGIGQAMQSVEEQLNIARSAPYEQTVGLFCSEQRLPNTQRAVTQASGEPAAYISASALRTADEHRYAIDAYVSSPVVSEQQAEVVLLPSQETVATFTLSQGISATRGNALAAATQRPQTHACIVFPQTIKDLFGNTLGADEESKHICARVEARST